MIFVSKDTCKKVSDMPYEFVERKGIGHPDTICDAIAEKASVLYSKYFLEKYGRVAHHWFDKVMLIGGSAIIEFGEGRIVKPYKVIFAGKCAKKYANEYIPLYEILREATVDVLSRCLTGFDPDKHVVIVDETVDYHGAGRSNNRYQPMCKNDLVDIENIQLTSNDCNLLSSYAPFSILERLVLSSEQFINGKDFKKKFPEIGWDVKLVGYRNVDKYSLLINMPFIASLVKNVDEYFEIKNRAVEEIEKYLKSNFEVKVELNVNPQDLKGKYYLTALGSVADTGDVGVVGRGNRINGLITPMRTMSIEAAAGKNPLDHTGKLYGVLSRDLAQEVYKVIGKECEVHIFTAKESALDNPEHVSIHIFDWDENEEERRMVEAIVKEYLSHSSSITKKLIFDEEEMW